MTRPPSSFAVTLITAQDSISELCFTLNSLPEKMEAVRRHVALIITAVAALLCATTAVMFFNPAQAQNASAVNSSTPVRPNEGSIIGGPNATLPARAPELQCQGCHGPGK